MSETAIQAPTGLPRLAQDYTPEQIESVIAWLVTLPLAELRKRQDIHARQRSIAVSRDLSPVALSEQIRFDMTSDAVSRQTFGEPQSGTHDVPEIRKFYGGDSDE